MAQRLLPPPSRHRKERKQTMKTAEEWNWEYTKICASDPAVHGQLLPNPQNIAFIKQIQLDAMKEGMRKAAQTECDEMRMNYLDYGRDYEYAVNDCKKAILTAVEQLTEKDLV